MSRRAFGIVAFCLGLMANTYSQCGQFTASFSTTMGCALQHIIPEAHVTITNGTPPYTLQFVADNGFTTLRQTNANTWDGYVTNHVGSFSASVTVTDALGCTVNRTTDWTPFWPIEPILAVSLTCEGMMRIDWNGQFCAPAALMNRDPINYPCGGTFTYEILQSNGPTLAGSVATDWTQVSTSIRRLEIPVTNGPNSVYIWRDQGSCTAWPTLCHTWFPVSSSELPAASGCASRFRLRTALAGAISSGALMNDQLRAQGLLPLVEPFSALGHSFVGSLSGQSAFQGMLAATGNNAIVDWVVVEVRSATDPTTVLHSRPALLQRDGDVVDTDGTDVINTPLVPANYHVAVRHRNHLGVMTGTPINLMGNGGNILIDLRASATSTYGTDARINVNGVMCLRSGDSNADGTVAYAGGENDRDPVLQAIGGSVPTHVLNNVYDRRDVNLDGKVMYTGTGNDRDIILQAIGGSVPTAVRTQQLP